MATKWQVAISSGSSGNQVASLVCWNQLKIQDLEEGCTITGYWTLAWQGWRYKWSPRKWAGSAQWSQVSKHTQVYNPFQIPQDTQHAVCRSKSKYENCNSWWIHMYIWVANHGIHTLVPFGLTVAYHRRHGSEAKPPLQLIDMFLLSSGKWKFEQ